jgi:ParB family transcriptional regulator, chromosome partitioning protein
LPEIKCFDSLVGSLEDIDLSDIVLPKKLLRNLEINIEELAKSIYNIGLMQPIIVRMKQSYYEIVAGCRRYLACKRIGWRKIPCHVVELDDKQSFEVSIIENIQRNSMNPVEEGRAFRFYVTEYGWGGVSELAKAISKNPSYISRRMKLTQLPEEILELINESEISATIVEELSRIKNKKKQINLATQIGEMNLTFREARKFIQDSCRFDDDLEKTYYDKGEDGDEVIQKILTRSTIMLKIALRKFSALIESTEKNWIIHENLIQHKNMLNDQISVLIKEGKKWHKRPLKI